jgi:hypothetical protein
MFDKAMRKSIEPYLQPDETALEVLIVQNKGMTRALLAGGVVGQAALGAVRDRKARDGAGDGDGDGVELASKMGIAITQRRLLIFKAGGAVTLKAKELITEVPISDVDSIEVGKGAMSKPITLTVRGEAFQVEAPRATNTDKLVEAFEQAKRGSAALA